MVFYIKSNVVTSFGNLSAYDLMQTPVENDDYTKLKSVMKQMEALVIRIETLKDDLQTLKHDSKKQQIKEQISTLESQLKEYEQNDLIKNQDDIVNKPRRSQPFKGWNGTEWVENCQVEKVDKEIQFWKVLTDSGDLVYVDENQLWELKSGDLVKTKDLKIGMELKPTQPVKIKDSAIDYSKLKDDDTEDDKIKSPQTKEEKLQKIKDKCFKFGFIFAHTLKNNGEKHKGDYPEYVPEFQVSNLALEQMYFEHNNLQDHLKRLGYDKKAAFKKHPKLDHERVAYIDLEPEFFKLTTCDSEPWEMKQEWCVGFIVGCHGLDKLSEIKASYGILSMVKNMFINKGVHCYLQRDSDGLWKLNLLKKTEIETFTPKIIGLELSMKKEAGFKIVGADKAMVNNVLLTN